MRYDNSMYQAIIKTLCYSAVFKYPLTLEELHRRLIGHKTSISNLKQTLKAVRLHQKQGLYFINPSHVDHRTIANDQANQKIKKVKKIIQFLKIIPSIEAVYVTGAVSVGNAAKEDDIDLMIITKTASLWTTRIVTNVLLDLLGVRRKPNSISFNNKVCLNLWLAADALTVPTSQRSLYTAYEVIQARPLFDRQDTHRQFMYQNRWITKYLPNVKIPPKTINSSSPINNPFEKLLYQLQKSHMKSKMTREKVSLNHAFFHPRNTSHQVLNKYEQLLKKYL